MHVVHLNAFTFSCLTVQVVICFFLHRKHQSSSSKKKSSHKHSKSKHRHREKKTSSNEEESEDSSSESEASGDSRQLSDKAVKESKSKQHHKHRHKHGDESHRRRHKKSHRKSRKHSSEQHAWNWQRASVTQPAVWMCIKCVWPLSDSCNVKSKDLTDRTDCLLTWCGEPLEVSTCLTCQWCDHFPATIPWFPHWSDYLLMIR